MLGDLGRHGFAELASTHLSVLLTSPKVPGEWSGGCTATGCWEGTILPMLYKQLTPRKRDYLLIENLPQAGFSVLFLLVEGGAFFIGVLNLLVPGVQILLTCLCFRPVLFAVAPALGKKLNRAMRNGDMVACRLFVGGCRAGAFGQPAALWSDPPTSNVLFGHPESPWFQQGSYKAERGGTRDGPARWCSLCRGG